MKSKIIEGYNRPYTIWEDGRVTGGRNPEKALKHNIGKDGPRVRLYKYDGDDYILIKRLLAEAFISNPINQPAIRHIDGNNNNISLNNLEWSDMKIIVNNSFSKGLIKHPWKGISRVDKTKTCKYCLGKFQYTYQNKKSECCSRICASNLRYGK